MKLENNKLLQGVITVVGIVLYLLSRKTKGKSKLTFLMIPICMLGLISLSCGNKKQDKIDINKALDNAIEKWRMRLINYTMPVTIQEKKVKEK